jgi:hypothetical protein
MTKQTPAVCLQVIEDDFPDTGAGLHYSFWRCPQNPVSGLPATSGALNDPKLTSQQLLKHRMIFASLNAKSWTTLESRDRAWEFM